MLLLSQLQRLSISNFLLAAWLLLAAILAMGLPYMLGPSWADSVHSVLLVLSYSAMYLAPLILLAMLTTRWPGVRNAVVVVAYVILVSLLFANHRLYDLYGFHFNGFVWNLITTPGGLESLGADQHSAATLLRYLGVLLLGVLLCYCLSYATRDRAVSWKKIALVFIVLTLSERLIYGVAFARQYGPILNQADHFIFYQPLKMNSLLTALKLDVKAYTKPVRMDGPASGGLHYPLAELRVKRVAKPPNIIILMAESLRYRDVMNPHVMPDSTRFAKQYATEFTHHYSGGNGTRQAMFAFFYGLYGNYWDVFLRARQRPMLLQVLDDYHYQYFLYTGARFTYPEFDQTIFATIPSEKLIETSDGEPWQRDIKNVDMLLHSLDQRNTATPFMSFVFFESTHAHYSFPPDSVIEPDYLQAVDYAAMTRETVAPVIAPLKARYLNAAHHVDSQFGRVYDYLIEHELLDNTLVLVTGDHGEEFMEHGFWGHNSSFVEEQIHVPMLLSVPGRKSALIAQMSSHMDGVPTLLQALGVQNPLGDYSLGRNLFTLEGDKPVVVASWTDLGLIAPQGKLVIPFRSTTQHKSLASDGQDNPVPPHQLTGLLAAPVAEVIINSRRYINK